jgi:two-component system alkaline phosphatase synthesis response regulator PhoP
MTLIQNLIREFEQSAKTSISKEEIINIIKSHEISFYREDLKSNGVLISPEKHLVFINGEIQRLPKKVFNMLYYFIENKNKVIRREEIMRDIWGTDVCVGHRTIDVHVRKIRMLGLPFIKTLVNGYKWEEL